MNYPSYNFLLEIRILKSENNITDISIFLPFLDIDSSEGYFSSHLMLISCRKIYFLFNNW